MPRMAPVWGLVLAGGRSRRFGRDKAGFQPAGDEWPWARRQVELARRCCEQVILSVRPDQSLAPNLAPGTGQVADCFGESGPLGALLSAWETYPEVAWMLIACDLPALDHQTLSELIAGRNTLCPATAFVHPADGVPEPLCTIYEPVARRALRAGFAGGRLSLRRYLERVLPVSARLVPSHPDALFNCNTPEEWEARKRD